MKNRFIFSFLVLALVALFLTAPQTSFAEMQGVYKVFLVNSEGTPASMPASVTVSFYDSESGGSPYWSETQTVTPDSGLYIVTLGQTNTFNLPLDIPYFLGVEIDGAEAPSRLPVQGSGSFSQAGDNSYGQALNVKYQWLDINAQ